MWHEIKTWSYFYCLLQSVQNVLLTAEPKALDDIKGNAQFIFLCNPQKASVNVCFMKILKSTVIKKVIVCCNNLSEENF